MSDYNLIDFRANIRTDLADAATFWSNAQLDRAAVRSVADLSRFLPREKYHELTLGFTVAGESKTSLATTNLTKVVNAKDISASVDGNTCTIASQPELSRPLRVTITDANDSITTLALTVVGLDENNLAISEVIRYTLGMSKTVDGKKSFKYVSLVTITTIAGNGASDILSLGHGDTTTGWIWLAYKPIKNGSVIVTNAAGTTTYTLNTDYRVDYSNGRIQLISGGAMAASTVYLVSYTKSKIMVDVSDITDLISVLDVEYPYGDVPQTTVSFGVFGSIITVEGGEAESQDEMAADKHIIIKYLASHSEPTTLVPSTYPAFLDQTVCQLAESYILFMTAYKYEQQAVTDFASARAALLIPNTATTGLHALALAAQVLADTQFDFAVTVTPSTGLFTEVEVALDAVVTVLGTIGTYLTGGTAPSVVKYLGDGDAYLNVVADANNVPENHAIYAARCSELATTLLAQADAYVSEAAARLAKSDRWRAAGDSWVAQANSYLAQIGRYLDEADRDILLAQQNLALAERWRAEAIEKRNEVWTVWQDRKQYVGDLSSISLKQSAQQGA